MTELQMGLIGLGTVAVVGVVAYNKWQEMRQRKQAEQAMRADHPDVLLGQTEAQAESMTDTLPVEHDESPAPEFPTAKEPVPTGDRIEPVLHIDAGVEDTLPEGAPAPAAANRVAAESVSEPAPQHVPETPARRVEVTEDVRLLSPLIDFIAAIDAVEPVPVGRILDAQREALARVRKPVRWIGYNEWVGDWELISDQRDGEYRHIRCGLQLVDRQGPAGENDLAIFSTAMHDLADQMMGLVELPARQQALDDAARLDQFCAGVDIQIGINVISQGQVFPGTKLRALAEAAGMTIDAGKRFVRRDEDGNVLYVLLNQEASGFSAEMMKTMSTHGLTFLLDVPCVAHGERVFNQMVDLARRFADVLHGALVDDNRRPLSEAALEPIRRQIAQYQGALAAQHLPAGNPLTLRLFS